MSIWDAFGKGRYKGFSREAGQLLDKAVELAGGLGCKKADTGHLLWAMLQADGGPAARFLAGKNITELEVRRQLSAGRDGSAHQAGPGRYGGGPAPGDGLRHHRGAERPPEPGRAGAPALRHAGRHRLRRRGHAGIHGCPAHRGGAGVPPAFGAVHPAYPAALGVVAAAGQPGQRQILPRFDPPGGGRRAGPGVLPGERAGPDGRDTYAAARRTTPALWGNRAWARPRWPKGLPSASPTSRCPGCSRGGVCWRWTWPASWLVRNTAATSKSGSRTCWKNSSGTAAPSSSWMSSTPSSAPVRQRGLSTRPAS